MLREEDEQAGEAWRHGLRTEKFVDRGEDLHFRAVLAAAPAPDERRLVERGQRGVDRLSRNFDATALRNLVGRQFEAAFAEFGDDAEDLGHGLARGVGGLEEPALDVEVARVKQQHAVRRQPVSTRAPGLLDVGLDRAGDLVMDHATDVGSIDAHPERVRRHEERRAAGQERLLRLGSLLVGETGVVAARGQPLRLEPVVKSLHLLAARAIDERSARPPQVPPERVVLFVAAPEPLDDEAEVFPYDAADEA